MPYKDPIKQKRAQHESYLRNKEKFIQRHRAGVTKLSKEVAILKSSQGCCFCPETVSVCLDFHHIDPKTKIDTVNRLLRSNHRKRVFEEIAKCIVICSNCHRKLHSDLIQLPTK